jgi:soluble lytic murein transglycosylase-like protein
MAKFRPFVLVVLLFGVCAPACRAEPPVYVFGDERGVLHLTNVPDDERYRPLAGEAPALAPRSATAPENRPPRSQYDAIINDAAAAYGLDPALVHAVVRVESDYNPRARSSAGAAGLMQLMAGTAARYGVTDLFDPRQNVRAGARHLRELLDVFDNDVELALAAYNAGAAAVERAGRRIPPYRETLDYVPRVLRAYVQNSAGR